MRTSKFTSILVALVVSVASGLFTQSVHSQPPEDSTWIVLDPLLISDPTIGRWMQGVSVLDDLYYFYGDKASGSSDIGVVVEYTSAFVPTGRQITLTENGTSLMPHPTALTWDDTYGTFMSNNYGGVSTIFKIDWAVALAEGDLDNAVLSSTLDTQGYGSHPEFVTVGTGIDERRLLATADYGTASPEIRLYDPALLPGATSTTDTDVTVHTISASPYSQNVTWNESTRELTLVQNVSHGVGWRLDTIDLDAAIAAGSVEGIGVRVSTKTFTESSELEGYRLLPDGRSLFAIATGTIQNAVVGNIEELPPPPIPTFPVLFEEDFEDGVHGDTVYTLPLRWAVHESGTAYVNSTTIDSGNSTQGNGGDSDAKAAIPGGPYTLDPGEFFRLSYVAQPDPITFAFVSDVAVPDSSFPGDYMQLAMGTDNNNQVYTHWNDSSGSNSGGLVEGNLTPTRHVRVEFNGSGHSLFSSADGITWTLHGVFTDGGMSTAHTVAFNTTFDSFMDSILLEVLSLPGDANGDRVVDGADATALANNWQTGPGATWAQGDFNEDEYVNDLDAAILAANWGAGGAAAAVPEPSSLVMLALGGLVLLVPRRRWWV